MRRVLILTVTIAAALVVSSGLIYALSPSGGQETMMIGSFFVSDAGQSHGGFEYTASYNVTLNIKGGHGTMVLTLETGLGDILQTHEYQVSHFQVTGEKMTMLLGGQQILLPRVSQDGIWNRTYDNYYIASWGSNSPLPEIRGTITPAIFSGVPSTYYVELRVK